jgi:hypothetical protein
VPVLVVAVPSAVSLRVRPQLSSHTGPAPPVSDVTRELTCRALRAFGHRSKASPNVVHDSGHLAIMRLGIFLFLFASCGTFDLIVPAGTSRSGGLL